jgi:4-hydroxybutyrate CoA-transferase
MTWMEGYRAKRTTAAEAAKVVKSGDRVYLGAGCAVPKELMGALVARGPELEDVEIIHILTTGPADYVAPEMADHFRCNAMFVGPNVRHAVNEGRADYVPIHLHQVPDLFRTTHQPDVAFVQVSPPDEHGFCSFGIEVGVTKCAALASKLIVAEVNRMMPRTLGDSFIHVSKLHAAVEVDRPLDPYSGARLDDVQQKIGCHVAGIIHDGDCLQLGIGGIPDSLIRCLEGKSDLGVHTEMFSNGLLDLIEAGIVNCEKKNFHPGKVIAGFILGDQDLYDFVHDNAMIEFHPTDYVNHPVNIARNDQMVAVNAALQVDLTGQVCADSLGQYIYSGFGGQVDFMRGAAMSKGGRPVSALPSTARNGKVSRIVPVLSEGAGVVTTRADVHYVVTEHGAVDLYGLNVRERARALIDIADPRFREDLERAAGERQLFGRNWPGASLD